MESDFLSASTKKTRRSLLAASVTGILISYVGISISKVSVMGTQFIIKDFASIPVILGLVVLYFLVVFIFNGLQEYRTLLGKARSEYFDRLEKGKIYSMDEVNKRMEDIRNELTSLRRNVDGPPSIPDGEARNKRVEELEKEYEKKQMVWYFLSISDTHALEGFPNSNAKLTINVLLPALVGLFAVILLLFFTKLPHTPSDLPGDKKDEAITEQVDTSRSCPRPADSLILFQKGKK